MAILNNDIITADNINVYTSKIYELFDEYLELNGIEKPSIMQFTGALKYIYINLFQPGKSKQYNSNTVIDINDINIIKTIWNIYVNLCYKYSYKPSVQRFCVFTGLNHECLIEWGKSTYRASKEYSDFSKTVSKECESALVDGVSESNSIGSMFLLKAVYGYRETAPIVPELENNYSQLETPEQISARHKAAQLPDRPDV